MHLSWWLPLIKASHTSQGQKIIQIRRGLRSSVVLLSVASAMNPDQVALSSQPLKASSDEGHKPPWAMVLLLNCPRDGEKSTHPSIAFISTYAHNLSSCHALVRRT